MLLFINENQITQNEYYVIYGQKTDNLTDHIIEVKTSMGFAKFVYRLFFYIQCFNIFE